LRAPVLVPPQGCAAARHAELLAVLLTVLMIGSQDERSGKPWSDSVRMMVEWYRIGFANFVWAP
jgi:hypothetical protein